MATRKFSAFTAGGTNQVPTDVLVGLDLSLAANAQNTKWTLNNLFAVVTRNITDGALRFGGFAAPAVSGAGEGSLYFDSTSNTFKISQNTGAYANIGNVSTTGFTATRVPIASGANTLTDDAGLTFNTTTNILSVGETTGGGVGLVGSNGNSNVLASQAPAATLLTYWPNAAPTAGQFLYAATVGAQVQLGYQTAPSGSGSANQIAVWGASNALSGSSALTFASGVVSVTGTTNPGVVITGSAATESGITVNQSVSGAAADAFHSFQTPSSTVVWRLTTAGFTPTGLIKANQLDMFAASGTVEMLFRLADASTRFVYGVNNVEAASINATSTLGLVLGVASTLTGRVRLFNSAGATYTQLSAGNAAASLNYILPATSPTLNQVLTASAPSGSDVTLSWSTPSGGSSLTATQVGFGSGANALTGSADFTYVDATGVHDLTKTLNSSVRFTVTNTNTGNAAQARFGASADTAGASLAAYSSTFTTSGLIIANTALLDLDSPVALIKAQTAGTLTFGMGNTARMTLADNQLAVTTAPTTGAGLAVSAATVTTGNLVSIAMTGTAAASNTKTALSVTSSGANGTASQTVSAASFSCTNTGTTNTNIALNLTASGAATANTALNVTAGAIVQASNLAVAFASGPNGATNPVFTLINNTASAVAGVGITGGALTTGARIKTTSSGSNEPLLISGLGTSPLWVSSDAFVATPAFNSGGQMPGFNRPHSLFASSDSSKNAVVIWQADSGGAGAFNSAELVFAASGGTLAAPTNAVAGAGGVIYGTQFVGGAVNGWRTFTAIEFGNNGSNPAATTDVLGRIQLRVGTGDASTNANGPYAGVAVSQLGFATSNDFPFDQYHLGYLETYAGPDASNYETMRGRWSGSGSTSVYTLSTLGAGTGSQRPLNLGGSRIGLLTNGVEQARFDPNYGLGFRSDYFLVWYSSTAFATPDLFLRRSAAANLALGSADAAAPVAQTLSVQNVVAGTANTAGANWTFIGSRGTGTGQGGSFIWQVAPLAGSSSTQNTLINGLTLTGGGQLYGAALHNNVGAVTGTTNQYVASGTYTPTVTAVANCTATSSGVCNWIRVGNVVTVSGAIAIDPTVAATFTTVGISLPIASNFATDASECSGVAANANNLGYVGTITADTTNDRAQFNSTIGTDVSNQAWSFSFTYVVL